MRKEKMEFNFIMQMEGGGAKADMSWPWEEELSLEGSSMATEEQS